MGDAVGHDAARCVGRQAPHRCDDVGIEGHEGKGADSSPATTATARRTSASLPSQRLLISITSGTRPCDLIQKFAQGLDAVAARLEGHGLEVVRRMLGDERPFGLRQPVERLVMEDDGLAVGGELQVAFDRVVLLDRRGEGACACSR